MKQFFGAYVLSPADVWSTNFEKMREAKEAAPMLFFSNAVTAFRYIDKAAAKLNMPATHTPVGKNMDGIMKLPGVGIMFNCMATDEVVASMKEVRVPGTLADGYIGKLSDMRVTESKCVFPETEFHGFGPVEIEQAKEELSYRYASYQALEQTLASTPAPVREGYEVGWLSGSPLRFVYGPNGMLANDFQADNTVDTKFYALMANLWNEEPGFQYMDAAESLYSTYRDVRARNIVNGKSNDVAELRAVVAVIGKLSRIAECTNDVEMEDKLQKFGEDATMELINAEKDETSYDEI